MDSSTDPDRIARWQHNWDRHAGGYDRTMGWAERLFFGDTRQWICAQADGEVLEVAVGTGLNLPLYPSGTRIIGVDWSPGMLEMARARASDLAGDIDLRLGDAGDLDFLDDSFDTVVATFSLCAVPDDSAAIAEMVRVLRPGGRLLLADHVASTSRTLRAGQWLIEQASAPAAGEHFLRRPATQLAAHGLVIERRERFRAGVVERLAARKPG